MEILIFILGLIIGSFLNVCIYRIPKNKSIINPPSTCGSCGEKLGFLDLVPLLSYIFLKGKCRHCGERISLRYPLVEIITGLIFLYIYIINGLNLLLLKFFVQASILIVVSFIDLEYQIIPDKIVAFALITGITLNIFTKDVGAFSSLLGLAVGGGTLLIIAIISGGAMGGGDIKLMGAMGAFLGLRAAVLALLISFILGGIIGLLLIVFKIKSRKDYIPFGPFLALGTIIAMLFYDEIIIWYLL
ncbi:MAG: leader peptidase (prepilin peptidase) / N-methyltransferase [Candidatus Petromonas sp.]|jgi:leader peptidase (prepilin peptidase)/N-methyltransferase|nr:leader peptidase (prepilin peptidase) / N-methyltransferase [Candidatus Petromonas sp.]